MSYFDEFNPFVDMPPAWPFRRLNQIALRASSLIRHFSMHELVECAVYVEKTIADEKALYLEIEMDSYVAKIVERGGWELKYAPVSDFIVSDDSVRWLLNNWPEDAEEEADLPRSDDLPDADALQDAFDFDRANNPFDLNIRRPSACFAVLALMKVEAALRILGWTKGNRWLSATSNPLNLSVAGDDVLEALEALWCSERMLGIEREEAVKTVISPVVDRRAEARRRGTAARNFRLAEAQAWTREQWLNEAATYNSKADFSRIHVNLIAAKFQRATGEPLRVTDRTIREVWLADIA